MKPHVTSDLLRGILVACVLRDAANLASYLLPLDFPWSAVTSEQKSLVMLITALGTAAYSCALWSLLFLPARVIRTALGILLAIGLASGSLLVQSVWSGHHLLVATLLRWLGGSPLTAAIAVVCFLKWKATPAPASGRLPG